MRICEGESFYQCQGYEIIVALVKGSPAQKQIAEDALNRWSEPSLMMFRSYESESAHSARSMQWKIKCETNDDLRQKFIDQTIPQIDYLGLKYPHPKIKWWVDFS